MTLKEYLSEHGLTQEAFALVAGLDQSTVSRLRSGKVKDPPLSLLNRVCEATGGLVRPEDFLPLMQSTPLKAPPSPSLPDTPAE